MDKIINIKLAISDLLKLTDMRGLMDTLTQAHGLTIMAADDISFDIRFSKTKVKNKYKLELDKSVILFANDLKKEIITLIEEKAILDRHKVTVDDLLNNIDRLAEVYYCNKQSNTFILKFKQ